MACPFGTMAAAYYACCMIGKGIAGWVTYLYCPRPMSIHDHDRSDEMNALLHAMLEAEACDLGTVGLVLMAQEDPSERSEE